MALMALFHRSARARFERELSRLGHKPRWIRDSACGSASGWFVVCGNYGACFWTWNWDDAASPADLRRTARFAGRCKERR